MKSMKTLLMLAMTLSLCCLPAAVQGGSNQVDLDGKGTSHLPNSGKNALATGQKAQNSLSAQQGKKALVNVQKQQAKNQAEMKKIMGNMNKVKAPRATKPNF